MSTYFSRRYYSGEKKAPILTIFIGGNHEASNYLQELPYGGWVAPNIYYMGTFVYITMFFQVYDKPKQGGPPNCFCYPSRQVFLECANYQLCDLTIKFV